jgi:hypothetical protein
VSTVTESVLTVVESVVGLLETPPPQATNVVAITKIAINFLIFVFFCLINFLYNKYTKYILGQKIFLAVGEGLEPSYSDSKSSIVLASWWSTPYYFSIS